MKTSRMKAPSTTLRLPRRRRSQRGRVDGATAGAAGTRTSTAASVIANAGVDEGVEDVHAQVDEDVGGGDDEDDSLHHGIVAPENGRDDQPPQSRDVEDDLRDERVAERVHPGHRALG